MRSTPSSLSRQDSSTDWSMSQPPSTQSVAEIRTNSGSSSGITPRSRSATRRTRRIRFSRLPPYSSSRRLRERREELVEQVAVGRVDLDDAEAGRRARGAAAASKASTIASIPAWSRGMGTGSPSEKGIGLGPTTGQPPASGVFRLAPPFHGRSQLALRPAWASWIPATAPCEWTKRAIRASGSMWASLQIPMSPGVIRPSRVTAVASTITRADAADRAAAEVDEVPVVGETFVCDVLAHGRHHDPIAKARPRGSSAD